MMKYLTASLKRGFQLKQISIEIILLSLTLFIGTSLRLSYINQSMIEHFDEGVYASNIWFGPENHYQYPFRHLYAPPLLPAIAEFFQIVFQTSALSTLFPSLLAGILTIGMIWWVARAWFGAATGLIAAIFAALSDIHLFYSRVLLTDVLLCFWLILSVYLCWYALQKQSWRLFVVAGFSVGLAWWTKYNGWLPLAISFSGMLPWFYFHRPQHISFRSLIINWSVITATAFLTWSPVLFGLQKYGGYQVVMSNHQRYLVSLSDWPKTFLQQWNNFQFIESKLTSLSFILAIIISMIIYKKWACQQTTSLQSSQLDKNHNLVSKIKLDGDLLFDNLWCLLVISLLIFLIGALIGAQNLIGILAGISLLIRLYDCIKHPTNLDDKTSLAIWLLAAWFFGLLVATPFYRPYLRLTLPWVVVNWLILAREINLIHDHSFFKIISSWGQTKRLHTLLLRIVTTYVVLIFAINFRQEISSLWSKNISAWKPRTGLYEVSLKIINQVQQTNPTVSKNQNHLFLIYAEPALFFQLSQFGYHCLPPKELSFDVQIDLKSEINIWLVFSELAFRDNSFKKEWALNQTDFEFVQSFEFEPSDLILLNQSSTQKLKSLKNQPRSSVYLYRYLK